MNNQPEYSWTLQAHGVFKWILIAQVFITIGIGVATDNLMLPLVIAVVIAAVPIFLGISMPYSPLSRHSVGIATQLMAALHIQQTFGMAEMHFQIFVLLAFLFFFKDWRVVVSSVLVVALHHVGFFAAQYYQVANFVAFEEGRVVFYILVIHALFAVVEGIVLGVMAHKSHNEAIASELLKDSVRKIMQQDGLINLNDNNLVESDALKDFNFMIRSVKSLIEEVNTAGDGLGMVVNAVTSSSNALDSSVDQQNQQVSHISSAMQEMTSSITEVAQLSQSANSIAETAKKSTGEIRLTLTESSNSIGQLKGTLQTTASAIADLSLKCTNIADVMQSIKAVAEQTNLLALNAAIESARAGEHGRGFAVVADEVRSLAIKSKESAEEIELITSQLTESANTSVNNMNSCVSMVENAESSSSQSSENMSSVLDQIDRVNENVTNVASSATQQASTTESISQSAIGLHQMFSEEKQQVNALKQEIAELNMLSDQLKTQLNRFAV